MFVSRDYLSSLFQVLPSAIGVALHLMDPPVNINHLFKAEAKGGNVAPKTSDTAQGNSSEEMWAKYKQTFDEDDKRIANAWSKDAGSLLVFVSQNLHIVLFIAMTRRQTGLFSAIVGAFIVESYKKLSSDSGDSEQMVVLLGQISQQLASFANSTYSNTPASPKRSKPSTAIITVNVMWLMSLVLSVTSALFATMLQQWARRYIEMPQNPTPASERARVRSFLSHGTVKYKMPIAVETVPTLLHLSVLLFFSGLVVFFFTIHRTVAIAVLVSVGVFAVLYFLLTILPYFDYECPYRTPISDISWYPWHGFRSLAALFLHWVAGQISNPDNLPVGPARDPSWIQAKYASWSKTYEKHWACFKDGFEETIIKGALVAPVEVDRHALTQMFKHPTLAERSELPTFMASVPSEEIVRIMTPPFESGQIIFDKTLLTLMKNKYRIDNNTRRSCLLVWLAAVLHTTKQLFVFNQVLQDERPRLISEMLIKFAYASRMKPMCAHTNIVIRLTSLSICALLAKLIRLQGPVGPAEPRWVRAVFGNIPNDMPNDDTILDFLVRGVFPHPNLAAGETVGETIYIPRVHVSSFAETLAIIMDTRTQRHFDHPTFIHGLSRLYDRMTVGDPFVANNLHRIFPDHIQIPVPPLPPAPVPPREPESLAKKLRGCFRPFFPAPAPAPGVPPSAVA